MIEAQNYMFPFSPNDKPNFFLISWAKIIKRFNIPKDFTEKMKEMYKNMLMMSKKKRFGGI